jgi:uncharacterized protein YkwD
MLSFMASRRAVWLPLAIGATFVAIAFPTTAAPARVQAHVQLTSLQGGVLTQLNAIRRLHGLVQLTLNPQLTRSAAQHTREMGDDGYFAHRSADGTAFWKRIGHWYGSSGRPYWSVGENLLWSSPGIDAIGAMHLWMSSPEHRANILDPRWREIGVSAVHFSAAPGTYREHRVVTIITTDFGVRR